MGSTMPKQRMNSAQKQPSQQVTSVSAGASLQSFGGRSVPNPILSTDGFQAKLAAQISGKPLSRLFTIEIFSGTGGLTAAVRRMGLAQSIGIDAPVTKQGKSPVIQINLAEEAGQAVLWRILRNDNVVAVHMGLPCGFEPSQGNQAQTAVQPATTAFHDTPRWTAYIDRSIIGESPRSQMPISTMQPSHGVGHSQWHHCFHRKPLRSHAWETSHMKKHLQGMQLYSVEFHHCMYGATRRKRTRVLCNHNCLAPLGLECEGNRPHDAWGITPSGGWATAAEVEYPHQLCQAWANCVCRCFLALGAIESPQELTLNSDISLVQASKVATGTQPRGKKLQLFMREYEYFLTIQGSRSILGELPTKCSRGFCPPLAQLRHPVLTFQLRLSASNFPIKLGRKRSLTGGRRSMEFRGPHKHSLKERQGDHTLAISLTVCTRSSRTCPTVEPTNRLRAEPESGLNR